MNSHEFMPFVRMRERIERAQSESDFAVFHELLLYGEFLLKLAVSGLVAAIRDDPARLRYRQLHALVRADSLGKWAQAAEEILVGPASQHAVVQVRESHQALTKRVSSTSWQHEAVRELHEAQRALQIASEDRVPEMIQGKRWLSDFAETRNKTRGHGALRPSVASGAIPHLQKSLHLVASTFPLFSSPWAFIRRNLSGKYRVSPLAGDPEAFKEHLSSARQDGPSLSDGVYVFLDTPRPIDLLLSDPDLSDFLMPNGNFRKDRFEVLSYITGTVSDSDGSRFTEPVGSLPASESQGLGELDLCGNCFHNLPQQAGAYVRRAQLERELTTCLRDDRHPVVTLHGPGGIGKTSLALAALHDIARLDRFSLIVWFSARDIDLTGQGPRPVRPQVLSETDIATHYFQLLGDGGVLALSPRLRAERFAEALTSNNLGTTLFVLDNFETVESPTDMYQWLNARIRLPNKVLITTRLREFKGDYPVSVGGMTEQESMTLMRSTAESLNISSLLSELQLHEIHRESSGHPYVMKILLGEVAKAQKFLTPERIVADNEQILTALFERTYRGMSPAARRVFLTACKWRSALPLIGLKAVVLRPANERIDVDSAVDSLEKSAFIELRKAEVDSELFVTVPHWLRLCLGAKSLPWIHSGLPSKQTVSSCRSLVPSGMQTCNVGFDRELSAFLSMQSASRRLIRMSTWQFSNSLRVVIPLRGYSSLICMRS